MGRLRSRDADVDKSSAPPPTHTQQSTVFQRLLLFVLSTSPNFGLGPVFPACLDL